MGAQVLVSSRIASNGNRPPTRATVATTTSDSSSPMCPSPRTSTVSGALDPVRARAMQAATFTS